MISILLMLALASTTQQTEATPLEKAWGVLEAGVKDKAQDKRVSAVHSLGLIRNNRKAEGLAEAALNDTNTAVRVEAANALGELKASAAIPKLKTALDDKEIKVVIAAANALNAMKDPSAYQIYYALLTGERKSKQGLVQSQLDTLHDTKAVEKMALEAGIGFIPYGGMGWEAWKVVMKNDEAAAQAAAAIKLANDPDPKSAKALHDASINKKWQVRAAAATALGMRGDRRLIGTVSPMLKDENVAVCYAAAAAVVSLESTPRKP
jgi:HEAT repeat protein